MSEGPDNTKMTVSVLPNRVIICYVLNFSRPTFLREASGETVLYLNRESRTIRV